MRWFTVLALLPALILVGGVNVAKAGTKDVNSPKAKGDIYQFKMTDIDGKSVPLKKFRGKVLLVVNVASKCGNTPQYAGLEKLYETYKSKGLVILGFPANEFGSQEPGTDQEIKAFCTGTYNVSFPMFSKIVVKGENENALYTWLQNSTDNHNDIEWNFAKFLVDRKGHVVERFNPKTKPDDETLVEAVEKALKS